MADDLVSRAGFVIADLLATELLRACHEKPARTFLYNRAVRVRAESR